MKKQAAGINLGDYLAPDYALGCELDSICSVRTFCSVLDSC